ncbi:hypothetical protein HanHA300_Chr10g0368801 [Helianthus annuus]|nr:hypothetical protein HanHA300_Chr10g0368801 [Helianthus annuus]KAJ0697366.1 hypothetical protein HanLR1_Chr10g0368151 [Helianthus annuus]
MAAARRDRRCWGLAPHCCRLSFEPPAPSSFFFNTLITATSRTNLPLLDLKTMVGS